MQKIDEAIKDLEIAETCCLCTDDRLRPIRHIQLALAKLREAPEPKCKTCKDTRRVPKPMPKEPHSCNYVNLWRSERTIPCPKCKAPTELKLPVFLPDDYDGLYSVAQGLVKRFIELYAENKELKAKPEPTEFTKKLRKFVNRYENEIPKRAEIIFLKEACDIIEQQAEHIELLNRCDDTSTETIAKMDKEIEELQAKIDKLVAGQQAKTKAGS